MTGSRTRALDMIFVREGNRAPVAKATHARYRESNCSSCAFEIIPCCPVHLGLACAQACMRISVYPGGRPCKGHSVKRSALDPFNGIGSSPKHSGCCICALSLASGVFTLLHLCVQLSLLVLGAQLTVTPARPRPCGTLHGCCDASTMQRQVSRPPAPQLSH